MINYISEKNVFQINKLINREVNYFEYHPILNFSKNNLSIGKYEIYMFYNTDINENNIYEVKNEDKIRIGWIFPVQALFSKEHEYSKNAKIGLNWTPMSE